MKAAKVIEQKVEIPALDIRTREVAVRGTSPLIIHKFSEKARKQMQDKQGGAAKLKRAPKVPREEFESARYIVEGKDCIPAVAFKKAMVGACRQVDGIPMTMARGAFHVIGDMLPILGPPPTMRTDVVRLESGVADIRYRPEFKQWRVDLTIRYIASAMNPAQLINLLNVAGFAVGVGENRPEKSGAAFGQFEVVTGAVAA